jgi:hypothetical protein
MGGKLDHLDSAIARFGYERLKPFQREVIVMYASGKDVFLMAPTCSGKSLTYEVAPLLSLEIIILFLWRDFASYDGNLIILYRCYNSPRICITFCRFYEYP